MKGIFDPQLGVDISNGTNLPHWFQPGTVCFVTFRTCDSMPPNLVNSLYLNRKEWLAEHGIDISDPNWRLQFAKLEEKKKLEYHNQFSAKMFEALDRGHGKCHLANPICSQIVADALKYFDGQRYHLGDFVVMPNHVHLLVCPFKNFGITNLCNSWKRFSAKRINKELGLEGRFWQSESFDHLVRSIPQYNKIRQYIAENPKQLKPGDFYLYQSDL